MRTVLFGAAFAAVSAFAAAPAGPEVRVPFKDYRQGSTPAEALKAMSLPKGFQVTLVAAEPRVVQPIAMCFDEKGRLWVVEGMSYPRKRGDGKGKDRILILEDPQGDGSYGKGTVFYEGLDLVSGIEVGHGGVWIGTAPELIFIPKDGQDKPGKPRVVLDGWAMQDTHETLNSFTWGPDGWLYGCHGVFTHSNVGKPGAPDSERKRINAGVWRLHPVTKEFEVFAEGTSNPWGLDYDRHGEMFITACVIPHLYHVFPGGRYQRQAGQHFEPFTYDDIKTIADHPHFTGSVLHRPAERGVVQPQSTDEAGGGHAHCGLAVYNGDNFPAEYRGLLLFGNLHGHRVLGDEVEPKGSGFVGHHAGDFMRSNDAWFIPVSQRVGPDGALYVSDWTDQQTCHNNNLETWDRANGRIYRVSYGAAKSRAQDLTALKSQELLKLALDDPNEFFVRQARKVLAERAADLRHGASADFGTASALLTAETTLRATKENPLRRLRALWVLASAGVFPAFDGDRVRAKVDLLDVGLSAKDEHLRAWFVRLMSERTRNVGVRFAELAAREESPVVRRELASALGRLPFAERAAVANALLGRAEDAADHNLPLLLWYGIEPLVGADAAQGLAFAQASRLPKVTEFIYRRLSADAAGRDRLLALAAKAEPAPRERLMEGLVAGVRQGGAFKAPAEWSTLAAALRAQASPQLVSLVNELDALAGDEPSRAYFRSQLADPKAPAPARQRALAVLVQARDRAATPVLHACLADGSLSGPIRRLVIQALSSLGDDATAGVLISGFKGFAPEEKSDALPALIANPAAAARTLEAVAAGTLDKAVLSPVAVRQLKSMKDAKVDALLAQVVGVVNATKADFAKSKAKYVELLGSKAMKKADLAAGKALFQQSCGLCHQLFGDGNAVGPNLTGSNRGNLDYLLENVLDPNALIGKDYQLNVFKLKSGNTVSGIVQSETADVFNLVMPGGVKLAVAKPEVANREVLAVSLMPEGLFDALKPDQVVNLVAYLQSPDGKAKPTPKTAAPDVVWRVEGALEGEAMKVLSKTGGRTSNQPMTKFLASRWSGNDHLWWADAKTGDTLTLALPIKEKGNYQLTFVCTKAHDYGRFEIRLDGKVISGDAGLDLYNPKEVVTSGELDFGRHELDAGEHKLEVRILPMNPAATPRNMFGLDFIKVEKK
jgi:putative membrane-bound dehydrogenase-like protein